MSTALAASETLLLDRLNAAADSRVRLPRDTADAVAGAIAGGRADPRLYAGALRHAFSLGDTPEFDRRLAKQWMLGIDALIEAGQLDAAAWATSRLARTVQGAQWLETWEAFFRRMPEPDPARAPFHDDLTSPFQLSVRPGAATLVAAFCGIQHRLGPPLPVIHRWLAPLDAHLLYLRDFRGAGFSGGIASVADGAEALAAHIRDLAAEHGASRIVTFGNSMGGYAALRYGPLLDAKRVLAFIPTTGDFENAPAEKREELRRAGFVDVAPLYAGADAPRAVIVFGADNPVDRAAAMRLNGFPNVTLEAIPGWSSHDVVGALLRAGRLDSVLGWLTQESRAFTSGAGFAADSHRARLRQPALIFRALGRLRRMLAT